MKNITIYSVLMCAMLLLSACGNDKTESSVEQSQSIKQTETESSVQEVQVTAEETTVANNIEEKKVLFDMEYDPFDYISMKSDYNKANIKGITRKIDESKIQEEINAFIVEHQKLEEIKDRKSMYGDTLVVNVEAAADGKELYNYKNHEIILGSGILPVDVEEHLENVGKGDFISLDMEYPKDYGDTRFNGKKCHFEIEVLKICVAVTPDYNDELVKEYTPYKTCDEYNKSIEEKLISEANSEVVAKWLDDNSTIKEYPEKLLEEEKESIKKSLEASAKEDYNCTLDQLLKDMGTNLDSYLKDYDSEIKKNIKMNLVYDYIIKKENLKPSETDFDDYCMSYAQKYAYPSVKELLKEIPASDMKVIYEKHIVTEWILKKAVN